MIKKIIWTIVLLLPISFVGLANLIGVESGDVSAIFNSTNVIDAWTESVREIISLTKDETSVWNMIGALFIAILWTAPFWYAWKGTFIVGWVPAVGFFLRIGLLSVLLFVPGILTMDEISGSTTEHIAYYMSIALMILALLGLWIKS